MDSNRRSKRNVTVTVTVSHFSSDSRKRIGQGFKALVRLHPYQKLKFPPGLVADAFGFTHLGPTKDRPRKSSEFGGIFGGTDDAPDLTDPLAAKLGAVSMAPAEHQFVLRRGTISGNGRQLIRNGSPCFGAKHRIAETV